jgi:hypothetical protein
MRQTSLCLAVLLVLWFDLPGTRAETKNDIKLIIDVSGSMKKNDPDNLRRPAVNLLMNLLPEDAHAAVWLFGDKVEPLVPYGPATAQFKARAIDQSQLIHSKGLLTNIGAALESAMLSEHTGGKAILLSDGMVDIGPDAALNEAEQSRIQRVMIPQLLAVEAEVHTVALSDNADKVVLESVAQGTGGLFEVARSADDLTRIFLRLFDDAVIQDRLPMDNGRFLVDSTVEEFTLLAFRSADSTPAQVKSPDDHYYLAEDHPDFVRWYQDAGFDLITIEKPLEGEWRLFSDEDPQNRVTVLSDLKLDVSNLGNVLHEASFPVLKVRFLQDTEVIDDPEFLRLMDFQLIVVTPSGKRIAKPLTESVNGVFTSELGVFAEPGRYRVSINVDGRTFQREVVQEVEYGSPARVVYSATERMVTVRPVAVGLLNQDLRMIARLENAEGKKQLLPLQATDELWQLSLKDITDGDYKLSVHVKGVALTGQPLDFILNSQRISLTPQLPQEDANEATAVGDWGLNQWLMVAAIVFGNVVFIGLVVWMFRRSRGDASEKDADAEISALLKQAPQPGAAQPDAAEESAAQPDTDESDLPETKASPAKPSESEVNVSNGDSSESDADDIDAAIAKAEKMRKEAEEPAAAPEASSEASLEELEQQAADIPDSEVETADSETSVGGMADIVDAWDNSGELDSGQSGEVGTADEADKVMAEPNEVTEVTEQPTSPEVELAEVSEASEASDDDDLMDEFQRAVNEQLDTNEDEPAEDEVDENAATVVLSDPTDLDKKDASSSG